MDLIVEAEGELLDLLVAGKPELIAHMVADRFAVIILYHREQAAQNADDEQQQSGRHQSIFGDLASGTASDRRLRLIDGATQQARDRQLQRCSYECCPYGEARLPWVAQRHMGDPDDR